MARRGPGARSAARPASRRPAGRGVIAILMLGFFAVAIGVISRRTYGSYQGRQLDGLHNRRDSLATARTRLEDAIRQASSRSHLGPIVEERLKMHVPKPERQITLPRPPRARGGGGGGERR